MSKGWSHLKNRMLWICVVVSIALLVVLEIGWLIAARLALNTRLLQTRINRHPERLQVHWESGRSWHPWRIQVNGIRLRGQGRRDQWQAEVDRADIRISLGPLFLRRLVSDSVRVDGVAFRLRPRLDAVSVEEGEDPADWPRIPGLENPPTVTPAFRPHDPARKEWTLDLSGIVVDRLREVWIHGQRLSGKGALTGSLNYEIRGPFVLNLDELSMPGSILSAGEDPVLTQLDLSLRGRLGPLRFKEDRGAEFLNRIAVADLEAHGDLQQALLLERLLGTVRSVRLAGGGRLDARVQVAEGRLQGGTKVHLASTNLEVGVAHVFASGAAEVALTVDSEAMTDGPALGAFPRGLLTLVVANLRLRHRDTVAKVIDSGNLRVRAVSEETRLSGRFRPATVEMDLGPLELADATALNDFLPRHGGMAFGGGKVRLTASYRGDPTQAGEGSLSLGGEAIDFRIGNQSFRGQLEVEANLTTSDDERVRVGSAGILLTNVVVNGVQPSSGEGWYARVQVDDGAIDLDGSGRADGEVTIELLDIRPLLALLQEDESSGDWVKWVPNLKLLRGGASVQVTRDHVLIRDLELRAKATEIFAQLKLRQGKPDGILYARYGLISAGLDFRGGARKWTLLGARRAYERNLEEMGLQQSPLPEDEGDVDSAPDSDTEAGRSR